MSVIDTASPVAAQGFADQIHARLTADKERLTAEFRLPNRIRSCVIDDLLPDSVVDELFRALPGLERMRRLASRKERKYVTAAIDAMPTVVRKRRPRLQRPPDRR